MAKEPVRRAVAQNRRARFDYFIDETVEAGIVLAGSEVKSLRTGQASLQDCYAAEKDGELFLVNAYIPDYKQAQLFTHEIRRPRKLLLKKRELAKLFAQVSRKGVTLIPLAIFFNDRGFAKVEIGVARGKKAVDKRETIKDRDWQRDKARLMRDKG